MFNLGESTVVLIPLGQLACDSTQKQGNGAADLRGQLAAEPVVPTFASMGWERVLLWNWPLGSTLLLVTLNQRISG